MSIANINLEIELLTKQIKPLTERLARLYDKKRALMRGRESVIHVPLSPVQINPDDMGHTNTTYIGVRKAP